VEREEAVARENRAVVPRAPNFCAFSRVSSNFEREYASTS